MRAILALSRVNLRLALRERAVLFFNYVFPLIFFFTFSRLMGAGAGGITRVVTMVLVIGILGSGLFGAGIRAVVERETNILRRYKVAPITPVPLLVSSMITGLILYLPAVVILLLLSMGLYHMQLPANLLSLFLFVCLGAIAFRAIGLIIAAVANSAAESNILVQMIYMPMLFLSGATFPISLLPSWVQIVTQFLPATYLLSGMQGIILQNESLLVNGKSALALIITTLLALLIAVKLFRWEKEEKLPRSAKLWIVAVFLPFLLLGGFQAYSREELTKNKLLERDMRRQRNRLIRNARLFIGNGQVIESGAVLLRGGKIAQVFTGAAPPADTLQADVLEASGKTLLPGLIDMHVHLGATGGFSDAPDQNPAKYMARELAAYLYSGVTAVKSVGDVTDQALSLRRRISNGDYTGAELFVCGPLFTAPGGHGTEYAKYVPASFRQMFEQQFVRLPGSAEEAQRQVAELKALGVDGIKAVLESGGGGLVFNRMDNNILRAIAVASRQQSLPLAVHTGSAQDVADAVAAGANIIEHGSFRDSLPDELLARMARGKVAYDATLSVGEAFTALAAGQTELLSRSLVEQVAPAGLLAATRRRLASDEMRESRKNMSSYPVRLPVAQENLRRAYRAGVRLVTGTDSGNFLLVHGPSLHRELQLYVQAGISPSAALQAATANAAQALGAGNRFGMIREGLEATLLLVDGNPLQDIAATERISAVFLKGERIDRADLFDQK